MSAVTPLRPASLEDVVASMVAEGIERAVKTSGLRLLDVPAVAERLSVGERNVWGLIHSGALPSVVLGQRRRLVRSDVLDEFIQSLGGAA